jgi:4-hydroxy-3-methylbut-2-enyl diphosphate reductase
MMAAPRGFCAGVERAIAIVDRAIEAHGAPVYVRHEIVHNARVVGDLTSRGAVFVEELDEVPEGAVTIFSAHGVAAQVEHEAQRRALPIYDATCPLVAKVHNHGIRFAREGRHIVLIGHAGHAEVEGTIGQIPAPCIWWPRRRMWRRWICRSMRRLPISPRPPCRWTIRAG